MSYDRPLEIHVHGQLPLRPEVTFDDLQEALKPLWQYAGARSLKAAQTSKYDEEPGIVFSSTERMLQMCWTVSGNEDFRQVLDDVCMNLNEIAQEGAAFEVTFFDAEYDEQEEEGDHTEDDDSRDDFLMLFVGPTPAAIMQVQRDLLVQDVVAMMERHFDGAELGGVVQEIDKLFTQRFDALVNSLDLGKAHVQYGASGGGHSPVRRPRRLH